MVGHLWLKSNIVNALINPSNFGMKPSGIFVRDFCSREKGLAQNLLKLFTREGRKIDIRTGDTGIISNEIKIDGTNTINAIASGNIPVHLKTIS